MTFVRTAFNYTILPIILMVFTMMLLPVLLLTEEVGLIQSLMERIFSSNK